MADRVAVFNDGKVQQIGTPEEIYKRPQSRFVADFVGSSNVLTPEFVYWIVGERRWASLRPEAIHVIAAGSGASRMTGTIVSRSLSRAGGPAADRPQRDASCTPRCRRPRACRPRAQRVTLGFAKDAIHLMEPA